MSRFQTPYLGAAYYPEAWSPEQVDEDVHLMVEAGLNVARIGEFAWSSMEPREEEYRFEWLHRVVDKLADAGIGAIMGTPTCTPPAWLTQRYPEVLVVDQKGVRAQHGGRCHVCHNSPVYRGHSTRIVTRLGLEFGDDENVVGWQIDNEIYPWQGAGCFCPVCIQKFRDRLRREFETIEGLNEAWGAYLWSQDYDSFSQVPPPCAGTWHHPSLLTAWGRFHSDSQAEYVGMQAEILHRCVSQPVGTDMMPKLGLNYRDVHENLDLVQYNHYDQMDKLWRQVFWMDHARPIKDHPFWNTETATCWNGSTIANGYKEPGFCRANSWLPIALGAEANLYWLWRAHWSGQELMHGSVVSSCGRPLHIIDEVREISQGFAKARDFLNGTRPTASGIAVHCSGFAHWLFAHQKMVMGFEYPEGLIQRLYRPLLDAGLRADVIDPARALAAYRLVISTFLPCLDEEGLRRRIIEWVEAGGTWVVGPLSDVRTMEATKYTHAPFGSLEEWAGIHCKYQVPADPREFSVEWSRYATGLASSATVWCDGFEARNAEVLATYTEGALAGLAAATSTSVGKGRLIVLGAMPDPECMRALLRGLAEETDCAPAHSADTNVLIVPRKGSAGEGCVVVELANRPGGLQLPGKATDLLTGTEHEGKIEVGPYQVLVLKS